jgi:hypothetical protein
MSDAPAQDNLRRCISGGAALAAYRLYTLDGAGRISGAQWIEAADDDQACSRARDQADGGYEVWRQRRLVQRVTGKRD